MTKRADLRVYFGHAVLLMLAAWALLQLWQHRRDVALEIAQRSFRDVATSLDSTVKNSADHVRLLRTAAETALRGAQPYSQETRNLFAGLKGSRGKPGFSLDSLPYGVSKDAAGNLTGLGALPAPDSEGAREMLAALSLNPLFAATRRNVPDAAWVYYTSGRGFTNIYPWVGSSEFAFSDATLQKEFFRGGRVDENPQRSTFWTDAYLDEAGKGLMCTVAAPVDDAAGRFVGTVALDLTLETLSSFVTDPRLSIGTALIVNRSGQLLAHARLADPSDGKAHSLKDALPDGFSDPESALMKVAPGAFHESHGWLIYPIELADAPWRLLLLIDRNELAMQTWLGMKIELAALLLVCVAIASFELRRRAMRRVKDSESCLRQLLDHAPAPLAVARRADGGLLFLNARMRDLLGAVRDTSLIGRATSELFADPAERTAMLQEFVERGAVHGHELRLRKLDGTVFWGWCSLVPVELADQSVLLLSVTDISERKRMEEELRSLATTDVLTGLANRRHLLDLAAAELERARRYSRRLALLVLDIDHFKQINDTHGHATGDRVIQAMAQACRDSVRDIDLAGRVGGEEFAIFLPETGAQGAQDLAERLRELVALMKVSANDDTTVRFTVSIGVAVMRTERSTLDDLFTEADGALYQAKREGRNRVRVCQGRPSIAA